MVDTLDINPTVIKGFALLKDVECVKCIRSDRCKAKGKLKDYKIPMNQFDVEMIGCYFFEAN